MFKLPKLPKYHWIPDLPDHRDHHLKLEVPPVLPTSVDLRPLCSPVEDQGDTGSCTGNSIVGMMEYLENKNKVASFVDLSRLFVYYNERAMEHTVSSDSGAMIRDGIKTLAQYGVCTEQLWPYDERKFKNKPTPQCYNDGKTRIISDYARVDQDLTSLKICLASGQPFVFGFTVYEAFESDAVAKNGMLSMPQPGEKPLGGHAVLAVGYNDAASGFWVRNSWGSSWGDKGYFFMPYEYMTNEDLVDDLWTVTK